MNIKIVHMPMYQEYIPIAEFENDMCMVKMLNMIVGMLGRSQLTPQQVRRYLNEVNNKRKDLLQKYIQLSTEAKVIKVYDDINKNYNPKLN